MKSLTTAAALILTSQTLMAADWRRADEYAHCLKNESARACREIYIGMRGEPDFVPVYRTAYELYTLSSHLLDTVHEREDMDHVWEDLKEVDEQFHTLEASLERTGWCGPTPAGCRLSHSRAFHKRRLEAHVQMFDKGLHQLIDEVDFVPTPAGGNVQPPIVLPPPAIPSVRPRLPLSQPTRILPSSSVSSRRFRDRSQYISVPVGKSGFRVNLVLR